jgi:predicted phosphodiesterase
MIETFTQPHTPLEPLVIDRKFTRVAVLSDVHGNLPALNACLADVERQDVEAVLFLGDFTWGPQPREVLSRVESLGMPSWFVMGNAERDAIEIAAGTRAPDGQNDLWMVGAHGADGIATISTYSPAIHIRVSGIGDIRLCHGSPRSDVELLTPETPPERIARACVGVDDPIVGHGHTHVQYQRQVGERTVFGPGSVGLPYGTDGVPGARWALLADGIDLRVTSYDIEDAIATAHDVHYPGADTVETMLRTPPTLAELVEDAESKEFSD